MEASFSPGRDVIGWRQSEPNTRTACEEVVVSKFARANNGIFAVADPQLNTLSTEHDTEMRKEAEETKLHRMAKDHDFLGMWQGSQNLPATQQESRTYNEEMTLVGYISDIQSDEEQGSTIEDPYSPELQDVSAMPNVHGLIRPTQKSKRQAENVLLTVNAIETRRNQNVKKIEDRICQCLTRFIVYLELEF